MLPLPSVVPLFDILLDSRTFTRVRERTFVSKKIIGINSNHGEQGGLRFPNESVRMTAGLFGKLELPD